MKEKINLPPALLEHIPWENETNLIWPASSFILHRNLSQYRFPAKMSASELQQTLLLLQQALIESSALNHPVFFHAEEVDAIDKEFLFEHFLCMEGFQNTLAGQGFLIDQTSQFFSMLNIQDHLQIQLIDCTGAWEQTWNILNQLETKLSTGIEFAYNSKFGYLTSDPRLAGTGLTVLVYLHLPALIHTGQLEETLLKHKQEEITATSMEGTLTEIAGDILVLKNTYTLGVSEETILHLLHATAMKLMAIEKNLRVHIKNHQTPEIKDLISRAFGLLLHSYQLQTKEAMYALSMLKLGLDLRWIKNTTNQKLNEALFACRKAHLLHKLKNKQIPSEEIPHQRAQFLHQLMDGVELVE